MTSCFLLDAYNEQLDKGENVDYIIDACEGLYRVRSERLAEIENTVLNLSKWTSIPYSGQLQEYMDYFIIRLSQTKEVLRKARQIKLARSKGPD